MDPSTENSLRTFGVKSSIRDLVLVLGIFLFDTTFIENLASKIFSLTLAKNLKNPF